MAAETELKRANALGVAESETGHLMAHALLLQGQAERAAVEARKAGPAHAAYAHRMLGRALSALGRVEEAARAFDRALAAAPDEGALWADIGRFRRDTGEVAGAIAAADRAVALDPQQRRGARSCAASSPGANTASPPQSPGSTAPSTSILPTSPP